MLKGLFPEFQFFGNKPIYRNFYKGIYICIYTMEIKDIQRKERKRIPLALRIKKSQAVWMKKNNVSPQALFDRALEELMKKRKTH